MSAATAPGADLKGFGMPIDESGNVTLRLLLSAPTTGRPAAPDTIFFRVTFGRQIQLQMTYLTSYAGMGVVQVALYSEQASSNTTIQQSSARVSPTAALLAGAYAAPLKTYTVNATIAERFSVPRTSMFVHPTSWAQWRRHPHANILPG